jgi:hypothetical protein
MRLRYPQSRGSSAASGPRPCCLPGVSFYSVYLLDYDYAHGPMAPAHRTYALPEIQRKDKRQRELTISTHRACAHSTLHGTKHQNQAPAGYCRIGVPARCICGPHQPAAHTHSLKWKSQRETISTIKAQSVRARDTLQKTKCRYQARAGGCHSGVPARCNRGPHQPAAHTHSLKWKLQRETGSTI